MFLNFLPSIITTFIMGLLAMAFFTLVERKFLGYFQLRKGPNKVGIAGLPQPFADALKLFTKEQTKPTFSMMMPFLFAPFMSLILALFMWSLYPFYTSSMFIKWGALLFLCISSLNVYATLIAGWSSNSKYALLGALRAIAQTISYEVSMALIFLSPLCLLLTLNMFFMLKITYIWLALPIMPLFYCWFISILAETNRTPFDFAEGESELVSGFNIEYGSGPFAMLFMAEYLSILIMCILTSVFWLNSMYEFSFSLTIKASILAFMFILLRATLPRMRYDRLMSLTWKSFLPLSLVSIMLIYPISLFMLFY
uniref:NADH-ubiquinone oxidoreductase chain 1 n=1 Tax=Thelepus plagiostoma TaxID=1084972 RepID=A0A8B6QMF9_9ANNE|nr:NADH dehydrogenase subunit 1 [Thelepus plagiostoma]QTJ29902.1 NADH dehydrogenase subunit 1 [Thelepus plagiostoma]